MGSDPAVVRICESSNSSCGQRKIGPDRCRLRRSLLSRSLQAPTRQALRIGSDFRSRAFRVVHLESEPLASRECHRRLAARKRKADLRQRIGRSRPAHEGIQERRRSGQELQPPMLRAGAAARQSRFGRPVDHRFRGSCCNSSHRGRPWPGSAAEGNPPASATEPRPHVRIGMRFTLLMASGFFWMVTVSTPFLKPASTFSRSTSGPSGIERSNRPCHRSL
jgi:hypothetical protein